jgi:hypothetical protein
MLIGYLLMNAYTQFTQFFINIFAKIVRGFHRHPILTIRDVSVNRCAWYWCVFAIDGTDRVLLRRLPMKVFSYREALEIAQAHIGLPRQIE